MTGEADKEKPILPPSKNHPGDRLRAVITGVAGLAPGGGFVTALIDDLVPTGEEKARNNWEVSISERTNEHGEKLVEHDAQLNPSETIDGAVAVLAAALAKASRMDWVMRLMSRKRFTHSFPNCLNRKSMMPFGNWTHWA